MSFPARYEKTLFVPIQLPHKLAKAMRSAAARALGPDGDHAERSGVEYIMRTVGGRGETYTDALEHEPEPDAVPEVPAVSAVPAVEEDSDAEGQGKDEDEEEEAEENVQGLPLESLSRKQLRNVFGRDALAMLGAMFQHTSKICEEGLHQSKDDSMLITKPNGRRSLYRKAQIHPTVVYSALNRAIACTAAGLQPSECFVQVGGGTPEGIVAAMMMGFNRVVYVASTAQEISAMKLPTSHDDAFHNIDYNDYISPNPDNPECGTMAAHAVQLLVPYVKNFVMEVPKAIVVPSPYHIDIPPLQTFTFIPVTGKVIARTVSVAASSPAGRARPASSLTSKAVTSSSKGGPGSAAGVETPKTPKKMVNMEESKDDGDDAGEDEDAEEENEGAGEGDEGNDLDADLAALEAMATAPSSNKRPKGGGKGNSNKKPKTSNA